MLAIALIVYITPCTSMQQTMDELKFNFVYTYPHWLLWLLVTFYFDLLYFGLGLLFQSVCKWLVKKGLLNIIIPTPITSKQIKYEIKNSLVSIAIFGFSTIPIIYLIRGGYTTLLIDTPLNIIIGLVILTVWNEIHFFVIHRIMHLPFFMQKVHYKHHASHIPTVYSVYSFHWFEALLLSTVPVSILWFANFPALAFALYPVVSLLLNFAGHCNYRFGNGHKSEWVSIASRHNAHHSKGKKNYGFASFIPDKIYNFLKK
jgi:Delta7-sterol 5-desaturase